MRIFLKSSYKFFYIMRFNNLIYQEYFLFLFYILVVIFISIFLFLLFRLFFGIFSSNYFFFKDKYSPYECGFMPYDDARNRFEIHFYIIALLFVIFDVEIILILPWVVYPQVSGFVGIIVIFIFLCILGFGFLYEWKVGALNWFFKN